MENTLNLTHVNIKTNGITLHVVQAGPADGEIVILLHGFPEFWRAWIKQIPALVEAGYRVWIPDQRGYNLSEKPQGASAYDIDILARDVVGLIDACGQERVALIGHDWGAAVAWWVAGKYPERLTQLVILNVPHLAIMFRTLLRSWTQMRRSWYIFFFQLPRLPEASLRRNNWTNAIRALKGSARRGTFDDVDLCCLSRGLVTARRDHGDDQLVSRSCPPAGQDEPAGSHRYSHFDDLGRARYRPRQGNGPTQHRSVRRRPVGVYRGGRPLRATRRAGEGQRSDRRFPAQRN